MELQNQRNSDLPFAESLETTYPTTPDADDCYYATKAEKESNIKTRRYPNGSLIKQVVLPRCNKLAVVRSIKANELVNVSRLMDKNLENYQMAVITIATTIDGNKAILEEVGEMHLKDFQLLMLMNADLNF